jgi:diguanylate cyclase (GGDEF)-like protein
MLLHRASVGCVCALLGFLVLAATPLLAAPSALSGRAPVVRFPIPGDVYPQNYDVAQDNEAILYVGNSDGVLIFDGDRWQHLQLPNRERARSLLFDRNRRIYVGGYDLFGYIERDGSGRERFHDLTPLFAGALSGESFADIWDIHSGAEGVFFRALNHVFLYRPDGGPAQVWRHQGRFGAIVGYQGETLLQFRGVGLKRLRAGQWELLPGSELLQDLIYQLLPLPSGGLLALASDGVWREYRDGAVHAFAAPADLPAPSLLARGLALADGTLAFAGSGGHLYIFDPVKQRVRRFEVDHGTLSGLIVSRDGGLFTSSDEAAIHVAWPSPWSVIDRAQGLGGSLLGISHWGERCLVLSGHGVYEARENGQFQRLDWSDHEVWDFLELEPALGLLADSYGLMLIDARGARPLGGSDLYPRLLQRSKYRRDVVFVGTDSGIAVLDLKGRQTQLLKPDAATASRVSSIVEREDGTLWLGTERDGIRQLRLSADLSRIESERKHGPGEGLQFGDIAGADIFEAHDGGLLATTDAGIFRWAGDRFEAEGLGGLDRLRAPDEFLVLAQSPQGEQWAFSDRRIFQRLPGGNWRREDLGGVLKGALQDLEFEPGGVVMLVSSGAILRREAVLPARAQPPALLLRAVEAHVGGSTTALQQQPAAAVEFAQSALGALVFRLALPEYRREGAARYQARMAGLSEQFSDWSEATTYTFRRLEPGAYRFEARAQDALGQVSELPPFRFVIQPPWYATPWGRVMLALTGLAALIALNFAIVRRRTQRLQAQAEQLRHMVTQRTRELESANRQLKAMAHLDGLTEIPNRRRLDDYLSEVWQQCAAQQRPMSVLVIDGDHFKDYNDREGHIAGDALLKELAEMLSNCLRRAEDLVARYGGDEFVVVMPGANGEFACETAESMRKRVEDSALGVTISVGIASRSPQPDEPVSTLVHEADEALYEAKRRGRNRVMLHHRST